MAKKRKLTKRDLARLKGKKVKVHYNLHQCRVDSKPKPGEACWSVHHAGKVVGYASEVVIKDAALKVQPGGRARIRKRKRREVVAWATGTLGGATDKCDPLTWNPYKDGNHFVVKRRGKRVPVTAARQIRFRGRSSIACGVTEVK